MRDESKDNAPNWESAKGGLATFVDQVKDKHLVQVEDHPAQMISVNVGFVKKVAMAIVKTQARN